MLTKCFNLISNSVNFPEKKIFWCDKAHIDIKKLLNILL